MFSNTLNFSYQRSKTQAFGFYFVYLFVVIVFAAALAFIISYISAADPISAVEIGIKVGTISAVVISVALTLEIQKHKHLHSWKQYKLLVLTALLATIGGGLLGLIIPSYLTTRPGNFGVE
mgnify:CR=1 FL=1